jgi:DNA-directed RNA polymerase specialized sigma subunit
MTELQQMIDQMLFEGFTEAEIATKLNISPEEVEAQICLMDEADYDYEPDYEDDADALASAGFGMDEDYGYACDDY